jgi:hypothetical protein
MGSQADISEAGSATGLGSLEGSIAYLERQAWWQAFRESRHTSAPLIDDVLWVGHFCGWLQAQRVAIERCTKAELDAYLATIASFRAGPRAGCERTVTALVAFLAARPSQADVSRLAGLSRRG